MANYREHPEFRGYWIGDDGTVWGARRPGPGSYLRAKWRPLALAKMGHGYLGVGLYRDNRKRYPRRVARLVLEAFVGPCPAGQQCCHLNGNKFDNRLANLMWGHQLVNMQQRDEHGRTARGERQWKAKLNVRKVKAIRRQLARGCSLASIGRQFGVSYEQIGRIRDRISWAHVP